MIIEQSRVVPPVKVNACWIVLYLEICLVLRMRIRNGIILSDVQNNVQQNKQKDRLHAVEQTFK